MNRTAIARRIRKGFTLVEILIVVIILGILAAIVIPQFTSASQEARESSALSLLQTIRSQMELYKLQHGDKWPTTSGGAVAAEMSWASLTGVTPYGNPSKNYGPYLQDTPTNPLNGSATIAAAPALGVGFVFDTNGKFYAVDADGNAFGN